MKMETKVSDLQLAAYLMALDYPLMRVEGTSGRKLFVFRGVPEEMVFTYYQGQDGISARKLFAAYRDLKGLTRQVV
jgi:hypothetical protein